MKTTTRLLKALLLNPMLWLSLTVLAVGVCRLATR